MVTWLDAPVFGNEKLRWGDFYGTHGTKIGYLVKVESALLLHCTVQ